MEKRNLVESKITEYYFYKSEIEKIDREIYDIQTRMNGVKSPNLDTPPVQTGEDRQSKLIRYGIDLEEKLELKKSYENKCIALFNELHFAELEYHELRLLELKAHRVRYSEIAIRVGYSGKQAVYRAYETLVKKLTLLY